jgi:ankyrin repeat protein
MENLPTEILVNICDQFITLSDLKNLRICSKTLQTCVDMSYSYNFLKYGNVKKSFTICCKNGRLDLIKYGIRFFSFELLNTNKNICILIEKGYLDIIKFLNTSYGLNKKIIDNAGNDMLLMATKYGHLHLINEFISYGFDIRTKNKSGQSVLLLAAQNGHTCILQELRKKWKWNTYDAREKDNRGYTALMLAAENGHTCILQELKENWGLDINDAREKGNYGITILMSAKNVNLNILKFLKEWGLNTSDARKIDNSGNTVLIYAAINKDEKILEELRTNWELTTSDAILENDQCKSAILFIMKYGSIELFEKFLTDWNFELPDIRKIYTNGNSLLKYACKLRRVDMIKILKTRGLDSFDILNHRSELLRHILVDRCKDNYASVLREFRKNWNIDLECIRKFYRYDQILVNYVLNGNVNMIRELRKWKFTSSDLIVNFLEYNHVLQYVVKMSFFHIFIEFINNWNVTLDTLRQYDILYLTIINGTIGMSCTHTTDSNVKILKELRRIGMNKDDLLQNRILYNAFNCCKSNMLAEFRENWGITINDIRNDPNYINKYLLLALRKEESNKQYLFLLRELRVGWKMHEDIEKLDNIIMKHIVINTKTKQKLEELKLWGIPVDKYIENKSAKDQEYRHLLFMNNISSYKKHLMS